MCTTLQHCNTATHCSTATYCNIGGDVCIHICTELRNVAHMQRTATLKHMATLQLTATLMKICICTFAQRCGSLLIAARCNTATHCNTLQHTATHCNTLQHTATLMEMCGAARCSLQHAATLQHTATHCNIDGDVYMCICAKVSLVLIHKWRPVTEIFTRTQQSHQGTN